MDQNVHIGILSPSFTDVLGAEESMHAAVSSPKNGFCISVALCRQATSGFARIPQCSVSNFASLRCINFSCNATCVRGVPPEVLVRKKKVLLFKKETRSLF